MEESRRGTYEDMGMARSSVLSQEHLETIFNASHDVVFILHGESNVILHVNDTVERVLGYERTDLTGKDLREILVEESPDEWGERQFSDGVFGPVAFLKKNGGVCQAEVTAAVIPWDGHPALLYTLRDATQRTALEAEKAALIHDLQQALAAVQRLSGLLPICANCKRIRDDDGYWATVEAYIGAHSSVHFSHSICPDCREELYPGVAGEDAATQARQDEEVVRRFDAAQIAIQSHDGEIDRVSKLRLYALRQQAMLGDCAVAHIDIIDGTERARINAWKALRGMAPSRARAQYIGLVSEITQSVY